MIFRTIFGRQSQRAATVRERSGIGQTQAQTASLRSRLVQTRIGHLQNFSLVTERRAEFFFHVQDSAAVRAAGDLVVHHQ